MNAGALIAGYLPGIPSPQQEGELGWDARVPMPSYGRTFLLQYKTARRTTALAGGNARFWHYYDEEYYRFPLHPDRDGKYTQHQLLLDAGGGATEALYCAPYFHQTRDLVAALQAGSVIGDSALIPVVSLGPVKDGTAHSVTYPVDPTHGEPHIHSEPRRGERLSWLEVVSRREQPVMLEEALFHDLRSRVLERRSRTTGRVQARRVTAEDPRAAAYLRAAVVAYEELNASLVVVPSDPPPTTASSV